MLLSERYYYLTWHCRSIFFPSNCQFTLYSMVSHTRVYPGDPGLLLILRTMITFYFTLIHEVMYRSDCVALRHLEVAGLIGYATVEPDEMLNITAVFRTLPSQYLITWQLYYNSSFLIHQVRLTCSSLDCRILLAVGPP